MKNATLSSKLSILIICFLIIYTSFAIGKCKQPAAYAGKPATICSGISLTLGQGAVAGNTYSWKSNPAGFSSSLANLTVNPTISTTYTLTETVSAGCSKSNAIYVTVLPLPKARVGINQSICSGKCTTIGGAEVVGSTYEWGFKGEGFNKSSNGMQINKQNTASVSVCGAQGGPSATTTYTLTETNSNGCVNSNSVTVTVFSQPSAKLSSLVKVCKGQCVNIGEEAVAGETYTWFSNPAGFNSNEANPKVCPSLTTTYTLVESTPMGCTFASPVTVTVTPCEKVPKR